MLTSLALILLVGLALGALCARLSLPKATVQAAIGSVPLALGLPCGSLVLSVSVLAILITAPLGAFLMDSSRDRLLSGDA